MTVLHGFVSTASVACFKSVDVLFNTKSAISAHMLSDDDFETFVSPSDFKIIIPVEDSDSNSFC